MWYRDQVFQLFLRNRDIDNSFVESEVVFYLIVEGIVASVAKCKCFFLSAIFIQRNFWRFGEEGFELE